MTNALYGSRCGCQEVIKPRAPEVCTLRVGVRSNRGDEVVNEAFKQKDGQTGKHTP